MTGQVRTVDGRVAGRRGQATRQKLLDCLGEMLKSSPYRDVKVIDVARMAGTSPATFYQYFPDVEGAVLELAEEMAKEGEVLTDLVAGRTWAGKAASTAAEELVAELGASFLCADLGVTLEPRADHAEYLAIWLKVLRADNRAIFTAASHAQRAAEYLHGLDAASASR